MNAQDRDPFALGGAGDPIIALIAEEDHYRTLGVAARERAEYRLPSRLVDSDPEVVATEGRAGILFEQIVATRATTIEGVAAKVEFLLIDPEGFVESILADLRALAAGGAA
jgi:hypothetical protein